MDKVVFAADLGGTNLRMAAVYEGGEILHSAKIATPRGDGGELIVRELVEFSHTFISENSDLRAAAFAIAAAATVNANDGVILKAPNLPELDDFRIACEMEKSSGIKTILENDANSAAIGEYKFGAAKGFDNSIMITLGTGVGGGIILNGEILRGPDGTAGEIGHITIEPNGHPCGCGSKGCLEQYASASAVVRIAKEMAAIYKHSKLADYKELTSADVYELAQRGDEAAKKVFDIQGFYLGVVLRGLVNLLNPEAVVFGGGASAGWEMFSAPMKQQIELTGYLTPAKRVKLVKATLGDDAGILGAAHLAFEKIARS